MIPDATFCRDIGLGSAPACAAFRPIVSFSDRKDPASSDNTLPEASKCRGGFGSISLSTSARRIATCSSRVGWVITNSLSWSGGHALRP